MLTALIISVLTNIVAVSGSGAPIYVGTFTYTSWPDPAILGFIQPFSVGLYSAITAINAAGGIHGRPIQLVECETGFIPSNYTKCMDQWKANYYPNMVAIANVLQDSDLRLVLPRLESDGIMLVGPQVGGNTGRPPDTNFTDKVVFLSADSRLQLISLVKKAVNSLHLTRIGFINTPDLGIAVEKLQELKDILDELGVTFTGGIGINASTSYTWPNPEYFSWLEQSPQAIICFLPPNNRNLAVLMDILNRSYYGLNNVDPNVRILGFSGSAAIITGAVYTLLTTYHLPLRFADRVFMTYADPIMPDNKRYQLAKHCQTDVVNYYGGSFAFQSNGAPWSVSATNTWTQMQFIAEILRQMQPANISKDSFIDKVFSSTTVAIDDLLFGMFSRKCSGIRAQLDLQCECNQGYRIVELYKLNGILALDPDADARAVSPFTECGSASMTVPPPLVYLTAAASDVVSTGVRAMLKNGVIAQFASIGQSTTQLFENATGANASALSQNIGSRVQDRYLSAVIASVLDTKQISATGALPVVDPFTVPATLAPAFQPNVLFISATLQQEIFALCQLASQNSWSMGVVARGPQASAITALTTKSLNSFGASPVASVTMSDASANFSLGGGFGKATLVAGLAQSADVGSIVSCLVSNPQAIVMVPFSEFSAFFSEFSAQLATPQLRSRLIFATSLRNWNATTLASNAQSPLMMSFFSQFPPEKRHPLALRGFIASAAVQQVISQISGARTPSAILKAWYAVSVIAVSSADLIGAYSNNTCFSDADTVCQTNVGARQINTMSLDDVTSGAASVTSYQSTFVFSSGRISYQGLPTSSSLSSGALAGIVVGACVGAMLLVAVIVCSRADGRNNKYAPKDPNKPFTLVFTDIQSSTALWANAPDAMAPALETHHELIRQLIKKHECYEVKTIGDSFMIACKDVVKAVRLSVELQHVFFNHDWGSDDLDLAYREFERDKSNETGVPPPSADLPPELYRAVWNGIRVRIGINTGMGDIKFDEVTKGYDYYGTVANIAARTESSGHGGQIVMTEFTLDALKSSSSGDAISGFLISPVGATTLRGVPEPVMLHQVLSVAGRKFLDVKTAEDDDMDRGDDTDDSEAAKGLPVDGVAGEIQSVNSSHGIGGKYKENDWTGISIGFISILFSPSTVESRRSMLNSLCERWHVRVSGAHTPKLKDDPFVRAIALRIGPMMEKKCGRQVVKSFVLASRRQSSVVV